MRHSTRRYKVTTSEVRERERSQAHQDNIITREVRKRRIRDCNLAGEAFRYDSTREYNRHKCVVISNWIKCVSFAVPRNLVEKQQEYVT